MLSTIVMTLLLALPSTGVVVSKRSGVNRPLSLSRAEKVRIALQGHVELAPVDDLTACGGKLPCLVKTARDRSWSALVTVETATVLSEAIVQVRLLSIDDDGKTLEQASVQTTDEKLADELAKALSPMREKLERHLAVEIQTPEVPLQQRELQILPAPVVEPPGPEPLKALKVETAASKSSPPWAWALVGASALILLAGATSFGISADAAHRLRSERLTAEEIASIASSGKTLQSVGIAGLISGGVLTLGSLGVALLWPRSFEPGSHQERSVGPAPAAGGVR